MTVDQKKEEILRSEQEILNLREMIRSNHSRYDLIRDRYEREYINERMTLKEEIQKQEAALASMKQRHCQLLNNL